MMRTFKVHTIYTKDDESLGAGKSISYTPEKTELKEITLENGVYLQAIQLQDFRGNTYLSPLVKLEIKGGMVANATVSDEFRTFD